MRGFLYIIFLFYTGNSIFYPTSLNGKRILMNGPADIPGVCTSFDGNGVITSVVFKNNNVTISELSIEKKSLRFPLRYFRKRLLKNVFKNF